MSKTQEKKEPIHCDEYVWGMQGDFFTEGGKDLIFFLLVNRQPAVLRCLMVEKIGGEPKLFADYKGKRVRVVMASRFGDVGITEDLEAEHGYSERVAVEELSNFSSEA
jgi:hypothetical protein